MQRRYIIILIISILIVIFATQNADIVAVHLWIFKFSIPVSLLIIGSLIIGAFIGWFFAFKELKKRQKIINEKESIIKNLEKQQPFKDNFNINF